ncbi:Hsp20/alpha crystallin family protein [Methanothermobacter sp.]|uniref:Hsp20/alpha crystallin family protein n=1 Tax=Methanothermobacter sp. TaxID=1884223 RepID=UPI003C73B0A7
MKLTYIPSAYITHTGGMYEITVEVPGIKKSDIHLEMTEQGFCLNAEGERFKYGGCWSLAHRVKPETASASFADGLLKITVELAEDIKGLEIPVE